MKQIIFFTILMFAMLLFSSKGSAQQNQALSVKMQQRNFYRKTLQVDSLKADLVANIQDAYKAALNLLMADTTLTPVVRSNRIQSLMDIKNQQFRKLLNPAQQEKIIPASERVVKKD